MTRNTKPLNQERLSALHILNQLFTEQRPLSQLLDKNTNLSPLTKELCFGISRHYLRLETLAHCLVKKKPKDFVVWLSILIGLYQLHYLSTPDYAAVQESVSMLNALKKSSAKSLVNAVLRTYCRERKSLTTCLEKDPVFHYGHPEWLLKRLKQDWPNHWQNIVAANDQHPPMSLRINRRKISREEYLARLHQNGLAATQLEFSSEGIQLDKACDVNELPGFRNGEVSVQDEAAQLAAGLLQLRPGLRLLDACAAPGGKLCHSLEIEPKLAECFGLDIDAKRLSRIANNLQRLNLSATLILGDALTAPEIHQSTPFDRILLDAPCSATGVIRRHPDIKWLRQPNSVSTIALLQRNLLHTLWPRLTKGGIFVYSTCSLLAEENEQQIAAFVANTPDCRVLPQTLQWGHFTGHGWQIFPGEHGMDGFFYSVLNKI